MSVAVRGERNCGNRSLIKNISPHGITVITLDFDSSNPGSIPGGVTKNGDMTERLGTGLQTL